MHPRRDSFIRIFLPILIVISIISGFISSYRFSSHNHGEERFIAYWAGMRAWLLNGTSPYSDSTASFIQQISVRSGDPNARVTYPIYAGFVFLPFAAIPDYALARALWMTILGIALLITALMCVRLSGWRTSTGLLALFLFLAVTGYPSLSLIIGGNATILAALFLIAGLDALRLEHDTAAGILFALSTIQPYVGVVALPFIGWWAFSHHRWLVLFWFLGLIGALSAIGAFFISSWVNQWLRNIQHYAVYYFPDTPRVAFQNWWPGMGRQAGYLFTVFLLISLFSEWWAAHSREFRWFLWTAGMTFIVAQWVGVPAGVENYVLLFLPLAIFVSLLEERGGTKTRTVIILVLLVLYVGTWALYFRVNESQLRPAMLFIPPVVILLLTYYVRWWATHPLPLLEDELRER